jgi:CAAX protease family protein
LSDIFSNPVPAEPAQGGIEPPAAPKKPRLWPVLLVIFVGFPGAIVFAVLVAMGYAVAAFGLRALTDRAVFASLMGDPIVLGVLVAGSEIGLALAVFGPALLSSERWYRRLGLVRFPGYGSKLPVLMLATFAVNFLLTVTLPRLVGAPSDYLEPLIRAFTESGVVAAVLLVLAITVLAGFGEEVFFRGYMQRRLLQRWPVWLAIGVTSLLFAAAHGSVAYAAYVFPLGVWLGVVAWRTGSVWCSAACHAFNNLVGVVMLYVDSSATAETELPLAAEIGLTIVALAVLAWGIMALRGPRAAANA